MLKIFALFLDNQMIGFDNIVIQSIYNTISKMNDFDKNYLKMLN